MRIAMLAWESLHSIVVGGVAQHVTELAAALCRQGHDVHVFTRIAPGQHDYDRIDGVHYYRCPYKGHHEFVDDVNNMCRAFVHRLFGVEDSTQKPFDIIHAHDWLTANAMIWIKKGRQRRGIFTVHATEYGRSGNIFHNGRSARVREQERAGTYWADHIIAVSHATRGEVIWMYEVPEDKISTVNNGVARHRFDKHVDVDKARRKFDIGPTDPVLLFCGRLDYQKGPDILLEAFPALLRDYHNAKLVYAGDGGMRHHLEHRARDLGIDRATRFLGFQNGDAIVELFKLADAVVVPSRNEPFGIVVLEAWCAGKPVLVTQNGGPSEYVWHEVNGLRIFDNPNSVAWGIHQLFGDFEQARRMGANGRKAVERGFTWQVVAERTASIYDPDVAAPRDLPAKSLTASDARITVDVSDLTERPTATLSDHGTNTQQAPATTDKLTPPTGRDDSTHERAPHRQPAAIELSIAAPTDCAPDREHLRLCEQTVRGWSCQTRWHGNALVVVGDWHNVFNAAREACRQLRSRTTATVRASLTLDLSNEAPTPANGRHASTETLAMAARLNAGP